MKSFVISILFLGSPIFISIPKSSEIKTVPDISLTENKKLTFDVRNENDFSNNIEVVFYMLFNHIQ